MERSALMRGDGRPVRVSSQYHVSPSSMPPPTAPMMRAASARSPRPSPASASASRAAARPSRSARARRDETPSAAMTSGGTSAAMRERNPSVSMRVMGRMAQVPAASPPQNVLAPAPYGLTTPRPLTTTRIIRRSAPCPRGDIPRDGSCRTHLGEDEPREAVEGVELLREVLPFLDGDPEPLFHGHRELDEVERVQPERAVHALGQGGLERHVGGPPRVEAQPVDDDGLQLVQHFLLRHAPPFVMVRSAASPRQRPCSRRSPAPPSCRHIA